MCLLFFLHQQVASFQNHELCHICCRDFPFLSQRPIPAPFEVPFINLPRLAWVFIITDLSYFSNQRIRQSKSIIRKHICTVPNTLPIPITVNKAAIVNLVKEIIYWWIRSSLVHKINLPVHQCCCTSNPVQLVGPFHSPCCWSLESSNKNIAKDTADQGIHCFYQNYN